MNTVYYVCLGLTVVFGINLYAINLLFSPLNKNTKSYLKKRGELDDYWKSI